MFEGLYVLRDNVPYLHPVLCITIALGAVVLASAGRRVLQLLTPLIRTVCRMIRFP